MTLFERNRRQTQDLAGSGDAASRALSVTAVETDFVERVYEDISWWYDLWFGPTLHHGRLHAIQRMAIPPGAKVLEVGVGTGINLRLYPRHCSVTGIDLSDSMLEKARDRVARQGLRNVRLFQMDAADLRYRDESFDVVYAPYVISVVPDPVKVAREMHRVCKTGGRIIVLNHFRSPNRILSRFERLICPAMLRFGFRSDLDLPGFLAQAELKPESIEKVNFPKLWSLVTCKKE